MAFAEGFRGWKRNIFEQFLIDEASLGVRVVLKEVLTRDDMLWISAATCKLMGRFVPKQVWNTLLATRMWLVSNCPASARTDSLVKSVRMPERSNPFCTGSSSS